MRSPSDRGGAHRLALVDALRTSAALERSGRLPDRVWGELAAQHEPCDGGGGGRRAILRRWGAWPTLVRPGAGPGDAPGCCLHHVFAAARTAELLGLPGLHGVTGPGEPETWAAWRGALAVSRAAGAPRAEVVDRLADALEDGHDLHLARRSAAAGPLSSARLLTWLPAGGLGLATALGAAPWEWAATLPGMLLLGAGATLGLAGRSWIRVLVRRAEQA